jgi:secondary thiamine-phosphate synthase enzyme
MHTTSIETKADARFGVVDLTEELARAVELSGATEGLAVAFCRHTTCVLIVNEKERGAQEDLARRLALLAPEQLYYAHDDMTRRTENIQSDNEPANGQAHVLAALLGGTSQLFPFSNGTLDHGSWQRLMLLELDDPRPREVLFTVLT